MKRCMVAVLVLVVVVALTGFGWAQEPAAAVGEAQQAVGQAQQAVGEAQQAAGEAQQAAGAAMEKVESTLIKEASYDAATQVLTLVMGEKNEKYAYKGVPENIYKELMAAESKGKYFLENIKGKFQFDKLP